MCRGGSFGDYECGAPHSRFRYCYYKMPDLISLDMNLISNPYIVLLATYIGTTGAHHFGQPEA